MEKILKEDLRDFAKKVLDTIPATLDHAALITLSGDLGAGKTTFVQALAKELGITQIVQSPTYVLMKQYDISNRHFHHFTTFVHIDAYRLEKPEQFSALKPERFLSDPHSIICIEWPEKVEGMLPEPDLKLKFSSDGAGEGERFVEIKHTISETSLRDSYKEMAQDTEGNREANEWSEALIGDIDLEK